MCSYKITLKQEVRAGRGFEGQPSRSKPVDRDGLSSRRIPGHCGPGRGTGRASFEVAAQVVIVIKQNAVLEAWCQRTINLDESQRTRSQCYCICPVGRWKRKELARAFGVVQRKISASNWR